MTKQQRAAANIVVCDNEDPIRAEEDQIQARIRERAFEISLERSHAGREIDDWLLAESEVVMSPPVEVAERDGSIIVRMLAAGVDPQNLTIMATRDRILIKADFRHDHESDAQIHACEFRSTMLFRTVYFPHPIDARSLHAQITDGMLRITARIEGSAVEEPAPKKPIRKAAAPAKSARRSRP